MGDDFISDLIERAWANLFSGRSLTNRNHFEDGENLPEIDGSTIYFYLNCGGFWGVNLAKWGLVLTG
jgi:hypothetical protein